MGKAEAIERFFILAGRVPMAKSKKQWRSLKGRMPLFRARRKLWIR